MTTNLSPLLSFFCSPFFFLFFAFSSTRKRSVVVVSNLVFAAIGFFLPPPAYLLVLLSHSVSSSHPSSFSIPLPLPLLSSLTSVALTVIMPLRPIVYSSVDGFPGNAFFIRRIHFLSALHVAFRCLSEGASRRSRCRYRFSETVALWSSVAAGGES